MCRGFFIWVPSAWWTKHAGFGFFGLRRLAPLRFRPDITVMVDWTIYPLRLPRHKNHAYAKHRCEIKTKNVLKRNISWRLLGSVGPFPGVLWRKDRYLMSYAQSTAKGYIRAKQKCIPITSKTSDSQLMTHSTVEGWIFLGENEVE